MLEIVLLEPSVCLHIQEHQQLCCPPKPPHTPCCTLPTHHRTTGWRQRVPRTRQARAGETVPGISGSRGITASSQRWHNTFWFVTSLCIWLISYRALCMLGCSWSSFISRHPHMEYAREGLRGSFKWLLFLEEMSVAVDGSHRSLPHPQPLISHSTSDRSDFS